MDFSPAHAKPCLGFDIGFACGRRVSACSNRDDVMHVTQMRLIVVLEGLFSQN
jgi:hypothetical protein